MTEHNELLFFDTWLKSFGHEATEKNPSKWAINKQVEREEFSKRTLVTWLHIRLICLPKKISLFDKSLGKLRSSAHKGF